jgi:hypothetical protein
MILTNAGVHVFGRHVDAKDWPKHQIGDPETKRLGALGKGLLLALECDTPWLTIGTGASEKDGLKESEYTKKYGLTHPELYLWHPGFQRFNPNYIRETLQGAHCDTASKNTRQEIEALQQFYLALDLKHLVAVTCPTHASRCAKELWDTLNGQDCANAFKLQFMLIMADVPFTGSLPRDVVIIEPPHRGDDNSPPFYKLIPRIFKLSAEAKHRFFCQLESLLNQYGV